MADQPIERPLVFLSSSFRDDDAGRLNPLRQAILDVRLALPARLFAYELESFDRPDNGEDDIILERCFAGIRDCDLFVFLMTGRHGSGTGFTSGGTIASYLELELFAAVTIGKPILILNLADRIAEPALRDSLDWLGRALSKQEFVSGAVGTLVAHLRQRCIELAAARKAHANRGLGGRLREWLSGRRTHADISTDLANPLLRFLDGPQRSSQRHANPDKARDLLDQVASGSQAAEGQRRAMPHGAALMRLWAAARELADERGSAWADPLVAPLWDRMLGLWASRASWFGLHGHLLMSPLAALNSQTELRQRFAGSTTFVQAADVREPFGGRASAHYSIANGIPSRAGRIRFYDQAKVLADRAIALDGGGKEGALSIRGHIALRMARLGYYWRIWDAVADLRASLDRRIAADAPSFSIGEAQADLGLALVLALQPWSGISLIEQGVTQMRSAQTPTELAFLARGLRKLETGYSCTGRWSRANQIRLERSQVAEKIQAFAQLPTS